MSNSADEAHGRRPSNSSIIETIPSHGRLSFPENHIADLEQPTLDPGHPRSWRVPVSTVSAKFWRQILGLNPFKGSYFGLFTTLRSTKDRTTACCGAFFAVAAGLPLPIIGVIFGKIISAFPPDEHEIDTRIAQLLGVAVAYFVVTTIYTISFGFSGEKIAIQLREKLLHSLLHLRQDYLDTHDIDINGLLSEKIDTIQVGCSEKVGIFIQSMAYFVAAFTVGFILNAKLTGILLAAVLPMMVAVVTFGSTAVSKLARKVLRYNEQATAIVESALRAVKVVQAFDMIDEMSQIHSTYLAQSAKIGIQKATASAIELGAAYFTAYAANGLAFYVGSRMASSNEAGSDAGTIYAVVFLILDASFVVGQFAPFLEIFARAASAYGEIQELVEACQANETLQSFQAIKDYDMKEKEIRFSDVTFAYPARPEVRVLNALSFTVHPGKFTAIVGTSGGGKSTLTSLLFGLYDYSGRIFIGSESIRNLDAKFVRSKMAVLDQDCVLFSGTVFDNICHGLVDQSLSSAERSALCHQAVNDAAVDFLDDLPYGINTRIDNTLQLSGGQRQRICLARALVKKPAILILDEPTSALDAKSEQKVMKAIKKAVCNGTTVLMIAHRLSTVLGADTIGVVSDGKVIEEGTPAELSSSGTIFRGLLDSQNMTVEPRGINNVLNKIESNEDSLSSVYAREPDVKNLDVQENGTEIGLLQLTTGILQITKPEHLIIMAGLLASIISGSIMLGEAVVFGNLVQLLNTEKETTDFLKKAGFFCLMFLVLALVALFSYICSGSAFGIASTRLTTRVQRLLLERVLRLDMDWFSQNGRSAHELTSGFAKDAGDLACLSGVALGTIFTVITSVCGGIILAHIIAWKISVVLLTAVPVMLISGYTRLRMLAKSELRQRTAYGQATGVAIESCRFRRTVTVLGIENTVMDQYHDALQRPLKEGFYFTIFCNTLLAFSFAISYFVYALAYWWGSKQVRNGMYSQKQFFTVLPALLFSAQAAGQLFSLSPEIVRAKTAAKSVFRQLAFNSNIIGTCHVPDNTAEQSSNIRSPEKPSSRQSSKIEFTGVFFSYSNKSPNILHDVSFSIADGETVAFVGPSGAGKSSTIGLIERFYDPSEGKILFEGVDIRENNINQLRSRMALVPQEPELFPGSISHNIKLGATSSQVIDEKHVESVARQCGLHAFITSLPEGYNTECGLAGGSRFSGGQRQRLALARALIRDPEVLLLDEPTSALDAHSEKEVQDALNEAAKGRTTIVVAHRLASIQHVDRIIVFDQGKVVEHGTHAELMGMGGLYASMAKVQAIA